MAKSKAAKTKSKPTKSKPTKSKTAKPTKPKPTKPNPSQHLFPLSLQKNRTILRLKPMFEICVSFVFLSCVFWQGRTQEKSLFVFYYAGPKYVSRVCRIFNYEPLSSHSLVELRVPLEQFARVNMNVS